MRTTSIRGSRSRASSATALVAAAALLFAACGGDDDVAAESDAEATAPETEATAPETEATEPETEATEPETEATEPETEATEPETDSNSGTAPDAADESMEPVKVGFVVQEEELLAYPELRGMGEAAQGYINAEKGGVGGHPLQVEFCGVGDSPESAVACAQQFANDDSIHLVLLGTFNTDASLPILTDVGKSVIPWNNLFIEMLTPGSHTIEAGSVGIIQAAFPHARDNLGATTATLLIANDPSFDVFVPVLELFAEAAGITVNGTIRIGFEADLSGTVAAANTDSDVWIVGAGSGDQCAAVGRAATTAGYEGTLITSDICLTQANVEGGDVDGLNAMMMNSVPVTSELGGAEAQRIIDTYGTGDVERYGTAGYSLVSLQVARDILEAAGGVDATNESVSAAFEGYSNSELIGAEGGVSCPGPDPFVGACSPNVIVGQVGDGQVTAASDWIQMDFDVLAPLLEG